MDKQPLKLRDWFITDEAIGRHCKRARLALLVFATLSLPGCSAVISNATSIVPSNIMPHAICLDLDRVCWGPYASASGTFYLEIKDNSLRKFDCFAVKCPNILKLADEQLKSNGWCPSGYTWDDPVWIRGVFRMTGRCIAPQTQPAKTKP